IDAYQSLIAEFGPSADSLRALEALYESASRWDELGETYERHLELTDNDAERLELLAKLGDLKREHPAGTPGALGVYRGARRSDPTTEPSLAPLSRLLETQDSGSRREAALILHPIYETEGDHEKLLRVLEIEVDTVHDPLEKLEGLEAALRVAEGPLG